MYLFLKESQCSTPVRPGHVVTPLVWDSGGSREAE